MSLAEAEDKLSAGGLRKNTVNEFEINYSILKRKPRQVQNVVFRVKLKLGNFSVVQSLYCWVSSLLYKLG